MALKLTDMLCLLCPQNAKIEKNNKIKLLEDKNVRGVRRERDI